MSDFDISLESISALKMQEYAQQAQVSIMKKALDQQASVGAQLIQSATQALPEGKGERLNIAA